MNITRIILIGYRGTGKTTVGRLLGDKLAYGCVDADDEIERSAGKTIKQIFATEGEQGFRDREVHVVADLCRRRKIVIAMGGGAILREENRRAMRTKDSHVTWLRATPETIFSRLHGDPTTAQRRPNLTAGGGMAEIVEMLEFREPLYRETADLTVETDDKTVQEIAESIERALV